MNRTIVRCLTCLLLLAFAPATPAGVAIWAERGIDTHAPWTLAVDPAHPERLLAGTVVHGLFRSLDGGLSWNPLPLGDPGISALAFSPTDSSRVYAGSGHGRLFASDDGGEHWTPLPRDDAISGDPIWRILVAPDDPHQLYVVTGGDLFLSRDGGMSWHEASPGGVAPGGGHLFPAVVALDPDDGDTLLVGVRDATANGVIRSEDGGMSWDLTGLSLRQGITSLAIFPGDGDTVVAGEDSGRLWFSDDGGRRWQTRTPILPQGLFELRFDTGGRLYAATRPGIFQSDDLGMDWRPGIPGWIHQMSVGGDTVVGLSGYPEQLLISEDRGGRWETRSADVVSPMPWPESPVDGVLYRLAGPYTHETELWRSDDSGRHWRLQQQWTFADDVPVQAGGLLVWDARTPETLIADGFGELLRSRDGGHHWEVLQECFFCEYTAALTDPGTPGRLVVGGQDQNQIMPTAGATVWISQDDGRNWRAIQLGAPQRVHGLILDPADPAALLVGTDQGVFHVAASGAVSDLTRRPDWSVRALAAGGGRLYAAIDGGAGPHGVAVSGDGGATWTLQNQGLAPGVPPVGLVVDPGDPRHLWVGLGPRLPYPNGRPGDAATPPGSGVYQSHDGGVHWTALNHGLTDTRLESLRLSPSGRQLLAESSTLFTLPLDRPVIWWDPDRSGMGVVLDQVAGRLWGLVYFYDADGRGRWASFVGVLRGRRLETELLGFTGPAPGEPWDPARVRSTPVGEITLQFQSALGARLEMSVDGVRDTLLIQPFLADAWGPVNRIWWQPTTAGQGIILAQVGEMLYGGWFFFDDSGEETWRVFQGRLVDGTLEAELLRFSGPSPGGPWDPAAVTGHTDGTVEITVVGPDRLRFQYRVGEASGTLALVPFP